MGVKWVNIGVIVGLYGGCMRVVICGHMWGYMEGVDR